jgi:hypothetical protein
MTIRYWDYGAETTVWTTAANWSGDTVPIAADEVVFDGRASTAPLTGMSVSDTGGIDFDLLHFKKTWTGGIGSAETPLHTSAQKIIIEGTGDYYIEVSEDATGKDQTIPIVIINNREANVYLTSNENTASWCCEFTTVILIAGILYVQSETALEYLYIVPINNSRGLCTVHIEEDCERYKATTYKMSIYMTTGTCYMDSGAELIEKYDGNFYYGTDLEASPETGLDIEILRHYGGTFYWQPDDSGNDAYIGQAYLYGGTVSASEETNNDRAKVLGNGAGNDIYVFEGATLNLASNMGNITIAASSQLWNFGGTITTDNGSQLAVSYDQP